MDLPNARPADRWLWQSQRGRVRVFLLVPVALALGAASPAPVAALPLQVQIADSGPLGGAPAATLVAPTHKVLVVTPAGLEPAPVPDPDAGGPREAIGLQGASLAPAFFSQKAEFAGDGFVGNSSADTTEERRRQPAAGLGLSIPVQQ